MSKEKFSIGSETVIGMVHCLPLPTTAGFDGDYQKILDRAVQDAVTLEKAGVDAVALKTGCLPYFLRSHHTLPPDPLTAAGPPEILRCR